MTISEVLNVIHHERIELEVFEALTRWMIDDRAFWIDEAMEGKAIINAIGKVAENNSNKTDAIEGIKNLCRSEEEDKNGNSN